MLLGVDVGGTFTDAVLIDGAEIHSAKLPTTPDDQSAGVMAAVAEVLSRAGASPSEIASFAHGMTVGTNALLEEAGARTASISTRGFADVLEIARQDRPDLYRLCAARPPALIEPALRFEVAERIGPDGGTIAPLEQSEVERIVELVRESDAEAVAICLLFSYAEPAHEQVLAAALRAAIPGLHVSVSHEVLPRFREYERSSTTAIDAYLSPLLGRYLAALTGAAEDAGLPAPSVMQSSGGVAEAEEAARSGAWSVLSGPAGGAVGAGLLARVSGDGDAIGLDMGGTSCDVCVVEAGSVRRTGSREIEGRPIQLPMVDVHTVGAGGGSIAWRDRGGALRVGPRSAGAEPGPACYGRGGREPTVTDANLLLGRLSSDSRLAGGVELDGAAAADAVARLADSLDLELVETAEGVIRIANQEMVRALRVMTVERGVDPRRFALLPFGGAGPMHAAEIAAEIGVRRVLCPRAGGVLSAFGLCVSEHRRDRAKTVMLSGPSFDADRLRREVDRIGAELGAAAADLEIVYELRYAGQAFELPIPGTASSSPEELRRGFERAHEDLYGHTDPEAEIVLVGIRAAAVTAGPDVVPAAADGSVSETSRGVRFDGEWVECAVLRGEPPAGLERRGPVLFELPEATLVVPPGWEAAVDATGTILVAEEGDG